MKPITLVTALLALAACVASCASPARLARQSDEALAHGDLNKAYDRALRAVEKDPQNAAGREAYTAASIRVAADYRRRVLATAAADTLAAADLALTFRDFRLEVARHGSPLQGAPEYENVEPLLLASAARTHYRGGRAQMTARHPRLACREFEACLRYQPGFPDAERRLAAAWDAAVSRVAVVPFTDGIAVPGLSQAVERSTVSEISARLEKDFHFTQLVPADSVEQRMTLSQLRDGSREDAREVGRRVGADLVVVGRLLGMHSNDNTREPSMRVFHRLVHKDEQGKEVVSWKESELNFVTRDREVTVRYAFDVLDVRSGAVVLHREKEAHAAARVAWTNFRPDEDCDHYSLLPPDVRAAEPDRARQVDAAWKERMGSWTLPEFLKSARSDRERARYSSRYRGEFRGDTRQHPVWMGELPGESELAFVALDNAWHAVYDALVELDRVE
jgi:hypothetical protein